MEKQSKHFVLVHGACHGAWCWYKVATLLKQSGHTVTALDLAASGTHPKQIHELRSLSNYFEPLMDFMTSLAAEERVILVGHSFGGYSISAAMEYFPEKVSVAVFCTAFMPSPDLSFTALNAEHDGRLKRSSLMDSTFSLHDDEPISFLPGHEFIVSKLYQLSPPEDLTLGKLLVRPHPLFRDEAMAVVELSKEKFGSVRRVYIVCDKDETLTEDFQRWMIEKNPVDEVKLISGSDHMLMFSKFDELVSCLHEITYNNV